MSTEERQTSMYTAVNWFTRLTAQHGLVVRKDVMPYEKGQMTSFFFTLRRASASDQTYMRAYLE